MLSTARITVFALEVARCRTAKVSNGNVQRFEVPFESVHFECVLRCWEEKVEKVEKASQSPGEILDANFAKRKVRKRRSILYICIIDWLGNCTACIGDNACRRRRMRLVIAREIDSLYGDVACKYTARTNLGQRENYRSPLACPSPFHAFTRKRNSRKERTKKMKRLSTRATCRVIN